MERFIEREEERKRGRDKSDCLACGERSRSLRWTTYILRRQSPAAPPAAAVETQRTYRGVREKKKSKSRHQYQQFNLTFPLLTLVTHRHVHIYIYLYFAKRTEHPLTHDNLSPAASFPHSDFVSMYITLRFSCKSKYIRVDKLGLAWGVRDRDRVGCGAGVRARVGVPCAAGDVFFFFLHWGCVRVEANVIKILMLSILFSVDNTRILRTFG